MADNMIQIGKGRYVNSNYISSDGLKAAATFKSSGGSSSYTNPADKPGYTPPTVPATEIGQTQKPVMPTMATPSGFGSEQVSSIMGQVAALQNQLDQAKAGGYGDTEQIGMEGGRVIPKTQKTFTDYLKAMMNPPSQEETFLKTQEEAGVQEKRQRVNTLSGQLSAITARAQTDNLRLANQGAAEGVTEAVYSAQKSRINNDAAIQALPLAAELASAQGDLQLAQEYATNLFKIRSEDAMNKYNYTVSAYKAVYDLADREDQRRLDIAKEQRGLEMDIKKSYINQAMDLANTAIANGQPGIARQIMALDHMSPTYTQDVSRLSGGIAVAGKGTGGGSTSDITAQVLDGFTSLGDLTPTDATKVRSELYAKGFGSDTAPAWFKEYMEKQMQQSLVPDYLNEEWIKYRDGVMKAASSGSGDSTNFDDY